MIQLLWTMLETLTVMFGVHHQVVVAYIVEDPDTDGHVRGASTSALKSRVTKAARSGTIDYPKRATFESLSQNVMQVLWPTLFAEAGVAATMGIDER